ncbi:hypothetical protein [Algicola sagamiensis]|uniref:hypothetical protein n=1 Tax=Algicola sagamiensis TaxID=163869 RepID=UPI0003766974|nr:hypothetical protein [Algicola sagamiensis]
MADYDKPYLTSGRNTIIHKLKRFDLVILNGEGEPPVLVSHHGLKVFDETVPKNRKEAKERYLCVVNAEIPEIFGEHKTLLFVQALDGKEYKLDYSKKDTPNFIRVHQDSYI